MLASVLNSARTIRVNIQIVRIFIRMCEMLETNKEILKKLELLERIAKTYIGEKTLYSQKDAKQNYSDFLVFR